MFACIVKGPSNEFHPAAFSGEFGGHLFINPESYADAQTAMTRAVASLDVVDWEHTHYWTHELKA